MTDTPRTVEAATAERKEELRESLQEIRDKVKASIQPGSAPTLVAVSKYKPASDILACYEHGQLDFGENYVQELVDKAHALPGDIRWHFIGTLQSNKAKILASIPNLFAVQTLGSIKAASALQNSLPNNRESPLRVLLQVNTSGEDSKSGMPPLTNGSRLEAEPLVSLAKHIITECAGLRLEGLMTIGSLEQSLNASDSEENTDFEKLKETRDILAKYLKENYGQNAWGDSTGKLVLSMGMSSDFEAALKAGSDIVRVGTGIFGQRPKKTDA
ncbi:hypothetical protein CVT24_008517 [Panaeolus cyanescens]|uniref:Pyridoxal phosphate homeostasis protein n=1 Tax=Panaeolus cyanescens TaxID=181874 RepID=A0A409VKW7_9AGAR|nr:hypothetical protein CVT24_008517 [Panaeolus cyanescens]